MNAPNQMREIAAKPGLKGWAHGERGHGLPKGLAHKEPLEIVDWKGNWRTVIVRAHGRTWEMASSAVDCGREFQTASGKWIPENDDRARRFLIKLRDAFHRCDRHKVHVHDTNNQERSIAEIEWILARNGWEAPPLSLEDLDSSL